MSCFSVCESESVVVLPENREENSNFCKYLFAICVIGIIGAVIGAVGLAGYLGTLSSLRMVVSQVLMGVGFGSAGAAFLTILSLALWCKKPAQIEETNEKYNSNVSEISAFDVKKACNEATGLIEHNKSELAGKKLNHLLENMPLFDSDHEKLMAVLEIADVQVLCTFLFEVPSALILASELVKEREAACLVSDQNDEIVHVVEYHCRFAKIHHARQNVELTLESLKRAEAFARGAKDPTKEFLASQLKAIAKVAKDCGELVMARKLETEAVLGTSF